MKSLIVFINTNSKWKYSKFAVEKTFTDEAHEDNYIAYMKRKGFVLDEVYPIN